MAELMKRRLYVSYMWNVIRIIKKSVSSAPEVLSGGPYNHAADWWSLGILLFALATAKVRTNAHTCIFAPHCAFGLLSEKNGFCVNIDVSFVPSHSELPLPPCLSQFPVSPEPDHCSMLRRVRSFPYEMPNNFSPPFALLLTEVRPGPGLLAKMFTLYQSKASQLFLCKP